MDVILLENIDHVGRFGERVSVKPGYARNYLLPQGKATAATPDNIAKFESRRAELAAKAADLVEQARILAEQIQGQAVVIRANTGPEGKLFGSVGAADIAAALGERGLAVERGAVRLPDGPIRVVGEYAVEVHLHADVDAELTVAVKGPDDPDDEPGEAAEPEESGGGRDAYRDEFQDEFQDGYMD